MRAGLRSLGRALLPVLLAVLTLASAALPAAAQAPALGPALRSAPCAGATMRLDVVAGLSCLKGQRYGSPTFVPGWSFSRASTEACQWADGHLTTAPAGVPCMTDLGLGIWESRTNLALQSQALATSPWVTNYGSIAGTTAANNSGAAPDGTNTATSISITQQFGNVSQPVTAVPGTAWAYSMWLKSVSGDTALSLVLHDTTNTADHILAVTLTTTWTRFTFNVTTPSATSLQLLIQDRNAGVSTSFLAWGAQLEAAAFPTPYIPTTSASVTRAADVPSLSGVTSAAAAFYQTFGVVGGTLPRLFQYDGGANAYFVSPTAVELTNNTVTLDGTIGGAGTQSGLVKTALGFDATGMSVIANGGTKATNASAWAASTGNLTLGNNSGGTRALNGYLQRVLLGPTKGQFDGATQ